jgi:hypothetical protein
MNANMQTAITARTAQGTTTALLTIVAVGAVDGER